VKRTWLITLAGAAAITAAVPGATAQEGIDTADAGRCDFIDPSHCLYPFPNNHFTKKDPSTDTGLRLNLSQESMPQNVAGKRVDPTDYNRNDGFSPGQLIVTKVPGLDNPEAFKKTRSVPVTDMRQAFRKNAPIVVIDAKTKKRHLIWSELDAQAEADEDRTLLIRPGVNFKEGRRYIVALRNLKDKHGKTIPAGEGFRVYRDKVATQDEAIEARRARFESIFKTLKKAKIARKRLFLAWDFTVASERNLSERMLAIRDDAFEQLGDTNLGDLKVQGQAPQFVPTESEDYAECGDDGCGEGEHEYVARHVEGRLMVPCYLDAPACVSGAKFNYGENDIPQQLPMNVQAANVVCQVPHSAMRDGAKPHRPALYGHGLLGDASQVDGGRLHKIANKFGYIFCGTDWSGMSEEDIPNAVTILNDISRMSSLADRGQQGMLNFLYLGRAMIHPQGLNALGDFKTPSGTGVIDTKRLYYTGGSQGGIMGGGLTAVSPDSTRSYLAVPGMNYSTLLSRSVDFDSYAVVMYRSYPDQLERQLLFSLVQLLWDRAEANGYAHHITTDNYPNTPKHKILMHEAFGDHQVTNVATEVMARTTGAYVRAPIVDPRRSADKRPWYGIPRIRRWPFTGPSTLVVGEIGPLRIEDGEEKGTTTPPTNNTPNRKGVDPHGPDFSEEPEGQKQIGRFLTTGKVFDTCPRRVPCYLDGWSGPKKKRKKR